MSIEAWNIIFNTAILAILSVGGWWLRGVVREQFALKDATIQAERARREQAERMTAPNIAAQLEAVSRFADQAAGQIRVFEKEIEVRNEERKEAMQTGRQIYLDGARDGLVEGSAALWLLCDIHFKKLVKSYQDQNADLRQMQIDILVDAGQKRDELIQKASLVVEGQQPKFTHWDRLRAIAIVREAKKE